MSHGSESSDDALDPGDKVEVVSVTSGEDIITYVEGKEKDHKMFGDYGDVIIYYKNGNEKENIVIHRAVVWIEYNASGSNNGHNLEDLGSFDVPSMGLYDVTSISLQEYGYKKETLTINLMIILNNFKNFDISPHSGYITKGDKNTVCDQLVLIDSFGHLVRPVKLDWIKGKADWTQDTTIILIIIVTIIIVEVIVILFVFRLKMKRKRAREMEEAEKKEMAVKRKTAKSIAPRPEKLWINCPECNKLIPIPPLKGPVKVEFRCSRCGKKLVLKE
jgi:hypothetical protein